MRSKRCRKSRPEMMSRQISRVDIAAGCAKILSKWRCRSWRDERKRDPSKGCSFAARGWAAKLKFLRSSGDAATHKKFKRFTLWLVLLLLPERVLPFSPNINSLSSLTSPVDWLPRLSPLTLIRLNPVPSPLAEMLTTGNFYPEKLGAYCAPLSIMPPLVIS